jgi:hypothetical protein
MMQYIQDYIFVISEFLIIIFLLVVVNYIKNKYFGTVDKQEKNFLIILRFYWIFFQPFLFIINKFELNFIVLLILCLINASFIVFFIQLLRLIFDNQKILVYQYYQANKTKAFLLLSAYILWGYLFIISLLFQLIKSIAHGFEKLNNIPFWVEIVIFLIPIFGEFIFKFNKHIRSSVKIQS